MSGSFDKNAFDRKAFDVDFWGLIFGNTENWTEKSKQSETWTEKTKQSESWTPKGSRP